jgi:hypothetical protein
VEVIYQNSPHSTVYLYSTTQILHVEFMGTVPSLVYRETLEWALSFIHKNQLHACLYNRKNLQSLPFSDHDWVAEDFLPQLLQSPIKKIAILESTDSLQQLHLGNMVYASYSSLSFEVQYFTEVDIALQWLCPTPTFHAPDHITNMALAEESN